MAEDEEPRYSLGDSTKLALPSGIIGGVIGAIIGVVLSLFAFLSIGLNGLIATIVLGLIGFGVGFVVVWCVTFVWYFSPPWAKKIFSFVVAIVMIVGIIILTVFIWRQPFTKEYLKFASPMFDSIGRGIRDIRVNWGACLYLKPPCPFLIDWESPNVQSTQEELNIKVEFSENRIMHDRVNLAVAISVSNPEIMELHVKPKCYLGKDKKVELQVANMGSYAYGDEFVFGTTSPGQELRTSLRCVGSIPEAADKQVYSENVVLVLERPVTVTTTWPIQIGEEPKGGFVKSTMQFNAPYSIAMLSNNDIPFNEGKNYGFSVVLKRRAEDVKFKQLDYMTIRFSEDLLINCMGFKGMDHEIEIRDYSYEGLKNSTQYEETYDKFSWPCELYVTSAPRLAVLSPVVLESKYVVYSDYMTRVIKSP
ncbi:MAG: hypothetical protein ACPLXC_01105 [Candidatus Pacearchaeota archaeon]